MLVTSNIFASRGFWRTLGWVFKFTIAALFIALPIRFFIAQPFIVSGASMEMSFMPNEYLVIDKLWFRLHKPERGDVIIMRYPFDPSVYLVKRIIAVPGEIVGMAKGVVTVTDLSGTVRTLHEPYIDPAMQARSDIATTTLAKNEYFVLGDNRLQSSDSRDWGPLQERFIVGRAYARLLPLGDIGILPGQHRY
jgi:signal peptidase I